MSDDKPKMTMSKTALITFISLIAFALFDLGMVIFGGTGSSVSNFLINVGIKSPIFCFTLGCTVGHLFYMMAPEDQWENNTPIKRLKQSALMMFCAVIIYEAARRIFVYLFIK